MIKIKFSIASYIATASHWQKVLLYPINMRCKVFSCRWINRLRSLFSREWGAVLNISLMFPYLLSTSPVATSSVFASDLIDILKDSKKQVAVNLISLTWIPNMNPVEPFCIFASDTKYFGRYKKFLNANNSASCYCIIINIVHCLTLWTST